MMDQGINERTRVMTDLAVSFIGAWAVWFVVFYVIFSGCKANDFKAAKIAMPVALALALVGSIMSVF